MSITLEIGTQNYLDDLLCIKKHLSHMESLLSCYASYNVSEPSSKFGWTFFKYKNVNKPIIVKNIKFINKNFLSIDKFLRRLFNIN